MKIAANLDLDHYPTHLGLGNENLVLGCVAFDAPRGMALELTDCAVLGLDISPWRAKLKQKRWLAAVRMSHSQGVSAWSFAQIG